MIKGVCIVTWMSVLLFEGVCIITWTALLIEGGGGLYVITWGLYCYLRGVHFYLVSVLLLEDVFVLT